MNKNLITNYFFYGLSQSANFLVPVLIVPHLIKAVGIESLGVIFLSQTIIIYLGVILDYHFNLQTVKEVSLNRNSSSIVGSIFAEAFYTRLTLIIVCAFIFIIIIFCYPLLREHKMIAFLSFPILVGQFLINNWFFQGLEKLFRLSVLNIVSKLCYVVCVLLFIKNQDDAFFSNLFLGMSNITAGIFGLYYFRKKRLIFFTLPSFNKILLQLKEGFTIFLSNSSTVIYASSAIFILGFFVSPTILGEYGVTDKIITIGRSFLSIYFAVSYPRVSLLYAADKNSFITFNKRYFTVFATLVFIFCATIFAFSSFIVDYFTKGNPSTSLIMLIRISAVIPIIVCLNIPAYQTLLLSNQKKIYTTTLISASVLSLLLFFLLIPKFQAFGAIYTIIITELYVTIILWFFCFKRFKLIKNERFIQG